MEESDLKTPSRTWSRPHKAIIVTNTAKPAARSVVRRQISSAGCRIQEPSVVFSIEPGEPAQTRRVAISRREEIYELCKFVVQGPAFRSLSGFAALGFGKHAGRPGGLRQATGSFRHLAEHNDNG